jgi:heme-degrading monooxygenase HmoA
VKPDAVERFEETYASDGPWVGLFSKAPGFIRTVLLTEAPGRYVTIDYWETGAAFDRFASDFRAEYEAMDGRFSAMTIEETKIGRFTSDER